MKLQGNHSSEAVFTEVGKDKKGKTALWNRQNKKQEKKSVCGGRIIESTTTLYRNRGIYPSVKKLQSTKMLAESWKLHIFDTGWIFLSLYKVVVDYFYPIPFNSCQKPLILR